jgi:predicted nucleic acid-binding protein
VPESQVSGGERFNQIVFCDANILYSSLLRDLLIRLALADLIDLRWSDAVHDEWIHNLHSHQPHLSLPALERTRALMERAVPEARVTGFEALMLTLTLPDPDDRHVLAAAVTGGATHLLTFNLKDFPAEVVERFGIQVVGPDAWLLDLLAEWPDEVLDAVTALSEALSRPALSVDQLLQALKHLGLPESAQKLFDLYHD